MLKRGPNDWPSDSEEETSQRSAFRSYSDANSKNLAVSWPLYVSWPLAEPTKPSKPKSAKAKQKKLREVEQEDLGEVEKPRPKKPRLQSLKASLVAARAEPTLTVMHKLRGVQAETHQAVKFNQRPEECSLQRSIWAPCGTIAQAEHVLRVVQML